MLFTQPRRRIARLVDVALYSRAASRRYLKYTFPNLTSKARCALDGHASFGVYGSCLGVRSLRWPFYPDVPPREVRLERRKKSTTARMLRARSETRRRWPPRMRGEARNVPDVLRLCVNLGFRLQQEHSVGRNGTTWRRSGQGAGGPA